MPKGGLREGSGRKTLEAKKPTISITIDQEILDLIDKHRDQDKRSLFMNQILKEYFRDLTHESLE